MGIIRGTGKTNLSHLEAIASHPTYSRVITEAAVELGLRLQHLEGTEGRSAVFQSRQAGFSV